MRDRGPSITDRTQKIAIALAALQKEAAEGGMWRTMHALNRAVQVVGWEAVTLLQKQTKQAKGTKR